MDDKVVALDARGPGRPLKVARPPSIRQAERISANQVALACYEATDPVLIAARGRDTAETLQALIVASAIEAATLKFSRLHSIPHRREAGRLASRRISALRQVAAMVVELHHLDPTAPPVGVVDRVVDLFKRDVAAAAREVLDPSAAERVLVAWERLLVARGVPPV